MELLEHTIGWVIDAIICWDIRDVKRVDSIETTDVISIFIGIRSALVVGVNATN